MANGELPSRTSSVKREMWKTAITAKPASSTEINAQNNVLSQLSVLAQHRLTRSLQSAEKLPTVLWCVLLVGGALTIVAACTFGTDSLRLQTLQVFSFSLLVSLSLVAIADIHRPFHGLIHVSDQAFRKAQQIMQAP
jgi:CHASE3 domain sensor protein